MNKKQQKILVDVVVLTLIAVGLVWVCAPFVHIGSVEYADNAQVYRDMVPVDSRVEGFVKEIRFTEFGHVHKGDTLLLLDDDEFRLQVAQAQAGYLNALAAKSATGTTVMTRRNDVWVSDAALEEARVRLQNAADDYNRYKNLLESESVTRQQYDAVKTQYEALKAKYEMLARQKESTRLMESEQTRRLDQNEAAIAVAEATLQLARLNLSYTVILSPCDGYVSRKTVNKGELIHTGQNIVTVVSDSAVWVMANFREKQMDHIRKGVPVTIRVDALHGAKFDGVVSAVSYATGARYSVVPQDNSTGNFVKVEQRIPVKINFTSSNDAASLRNLSAGMNVECEVK